MAAATAHAGKTTAIATGNGGVTTPEAHDSARCGVLPARQWPSIQVEPETLPAPGDAVEDLETPVLVVDLDRMEANIRFVQAYCERLGVRNRIHIKTHKIPQIAARQVAAGAAGITVQKLGEAEVFAGSGLGFDDIFLPYNLLGAAKLRRLRAFLERYPEIELSLTCDSAVVAEGLNTVARESGRRLRVWVECDAGLGRAGVTQPRQALDLACAIEQLPQPDVWRPDVVHRRRGAERSVHDRSPRRIPQRGPAGTGSHDGGHAAAAVGKASPGCDRAPARHLRLSRPPDRAAGRLVIR